MKFTRWFDPDVKPSLPGVYQVMPGTEIEWYRRWNGERWFAGRDTVESAYREAFPLGRFIKDQWRGLARKPKEGYGR